MQLGDATHLRAYRRYSQKDDAIGLDGTGLRDNSRSARSGIRLDWDHSDADRLTVHSDFFDWDGYHRAGGPSFEPPFSRTGRESYGQSGQSVVSRWVYTISPTSETGFKFYYDQTQMRLSGLREERQTLDFDFQHRSRFTKSQDLIWGLGYRRSWDRFENSFVYSFSPVSAPTDLFSVFVQDDIELLPERLRLTVGTKFERVVHDHGGENGKVGFNSVQPNLRLLWIPTESQSFWASAARAARNPSRGKQAIRLSLFAVPPGTPLSPSLPILVTIEGSPRFGPEIVQAYEGGYRTVISDRLSLDLAGFYNSYADLRSASVMGTSFQPSPVPHLKTPMKFLNGLEGNTYGIEAALRWQPSHQWRGRISYSYIQPNFYPETSATVDPNPANVLTSLLPDFGGSLLGEAPRHQIFVGSSLDVTPTLRLNADFRWVDDLIRLDDYSELGASLSWKGGEDLTFSIGAHDLLHRSHQEFSREAFEYPSQIERGVYVKVTQEF